MMRERGVRYSHSALLFLDDGCIDGFRGLIFNWIQSHPKMVFKGFGDDELILGIRRRRTALVVF